MLVMAALTITVHLTELFVARRVDVASDAAPGHGFDLTQPWLLFAVDVAAWHFKPQRCARRMHGYVSSLGGRGGGALPPEPPPEVVAPCQRGGDHGHGAGGQHQTPLG